MTGPVWAPRRGLLAVDQLLLGRRWHGGLLRDRCRGPATGSERNGPKAPDDGFGGPAQTDALLSVLDAAEERYTTAMSSTRTP